MKRFLGVFIALILCSPAISTPAFALDGVWHDPYGLNCIYDIQPDERLPRNPVAGENVLVRSTTWPIEFGQTVWITYKKMEYNSKQLVRHGNTTTETILIGKPIWEVFEKAM